MNPLSPPSLPPESLAPSMSPLPPEPHLLSLLPLTVPCSPPEKSVIVTTEEREVFVEVCQRIEEVVVYQLQNFRIYFPFCCPKADLRTTLKLFDLVSLSSFLNVQYIPHPLPLPFVPPLFQVSTINHSSRGSMEDSPLKLLTLSMEKAALINYKQVYSKLECKTSVSIL